MREQGNPNHVQLPGLACAPYDLNDGMTMMSERGWGQGRGAKSGFDAAMVTRSQALLYALFDTTPLRSLLAAAFLETFLVLLSSCGTYSTGGGQRIQRHEQCRHAISACIPYLNKHSTYLSSIYIIIKKIKSMQNSRNLIAETCSDSVSRALQACYKLLQAYPS